ncbi:hypothetical protein ACRAWD_31490 [Caulobacter segnis]
MIADLLANKPLSSEDRAAVRAEARGPGARGAPQRPQARRGRELPAGVQPGHSRGPGPDAAWLRRCCAPPTTTPATS